MFYMSQNMPDVLCKEYAQVFWYVHEFLKEQHPFRSGAICPHIARAERANAVHYKIVKSGQTKQIQVAIESSLSHHANNNDTGSTILLFPRKVWLHRLRRVRNKYLAQTHQAGMLLGLLHPHDNSESKYGRDFFPLRSPMPIMTIRSMLVSDLDMFRDSTWDKGVQRRLLQGYIKRFQDVPDEKTKRLVSIAKRLV